jgi:integrase
VRGYRQHLERHIIPYLGKVKLPALTVEMVEDWRNQLFAEGRSRDMIKRVTTSLGAILTTAKLAQNVIANLDRDREKQFAKRHKRRLAIGTDIPDKSEIRSLLAVEGELKWRALLVTAVFTGLRSSELRGLRWTDVDLAGAVLHIRQRADRWNMIGAPKSATSQRAVPLVPLVVNTLRQWKLASPGAGALVFANAGGEPLDMSNLYRDGLDRVFVAARLVDTTGRRKYGLHALRHAAASLFIEQGWSAKRVQTIMGHSSIQVTFDTYGHLFPAEDDSALLQQLQARLLGPAGG